MKLNKRQLVESMGLDISEIRDAFEYIIEKYAINKDDLYENGAIYYMNGNDGTAFDYQMNNRACEFYIFWKNEDGAAKCLIYDEKMEFFIYDRENPFDSKLTKEETLDHGFNLHDLVEYLEGTFDSRKVYDQPVTNWVLDNRTWVEGPEDEEADDWEDYPEEEEEEEDDSYDDLDESLNSKYYILFNHFDPENLHFVKDIPQDSSLWESDYIIEDVTSMINKQVLIEWNDESLYVNDHPKSLSDVDKELIADLKQQMNDQPENDEFNLLSLDGEEFYVSLNDLEMSKGIDNLTIYSDFINNSHVDGDSGYGRYLTTLKDSDFDSYVDSVFGDDVTNENLNGEDPFMESKKRANLDPIVESTSKVIFGESAVVDKTNYKELLLKYYGKEAINLAREAHLTPKSVYFYMESHSFFDPVISLKEELENNFDKEEFLKIYG